MNKNGFAIVGIIIAIIIATIVAGGVYYSVNKKTNEPVSITTPVNNQETLSQLLSVSEESKTFLNELQRLNPKLDINKADLVYSEPIYSIQKTAVMHDSNNTSRSVSPNGQNIFFHYRCYEEGDIETLDVMTTTNNDEVKTIFDWGRTCPNGNGFWLSDTKLVYLHTYRYIQTEPESANRTPASTSAVTIHVFDLTKNINDTYYVTSPDAIIWPS